MMTRKEERMPWIAKTMTMPRSEITEQLRDFEEHYGVSSSHLREAFTVAGKLEETTDFRRWSRLYTVYSRTTSAAS